MKDLAERVKQSAAKPSSRQLPGLKLVVGTTQTLAPSARDAEALRKRVYDIVATEAARAAGRLPAGPATLSRSSTPRARS